MNSAKWIALWIPVILTLAGCGSEATVPSAAETAEITILPAWKLPGDYKIPGKADSYDDYRAAHPEWYALTESPKKDGFGFFTEWGDKQAWLLSSVGANSMLGQIAAAAIEYVDFHIIVPTSGPGNIISILASAGISGSILADHVHFHEFGPDSIWMIDYGPFPLTEPDGSIAFTDFRYYHQRVYDDAIPTKLGQAWGVSTYRGGLDLEGGNLQMDEMGTCYFSQGAYWENPDKTQAEVQQVLSDYLGCKSFIVLSPLQDGTSHMDMFSKLTSNNDFVLGKCNTTNCTTTTINALTTNATLLEGVVLADGTKLNLHRIPMPYQKDGVWRTYTNSTLANGVHVWPIYSVSTSEQAEALDVWKAALPDWIHVGVNSDSIIKSGGAVHCISRTVPVGSLVEWVPGGPKWICNFNDCAGQGCDGLTYEGCCDGNLLKWCENNQISTQSCAAGTCGWSSSQGFYNCNTGGGEDPSGLHPKDCNPCEPDCTNKECGDDGCDGSCGSCTDSQTCVNGTCQDICVPDCAGKNCGNDGCDGSCGTCTGTDSCIDGKCVPCIPDCADKDCGDDGCDGTCGSCSCGEVCQSGSCVFTACQGNECGSDGCGGTCGSCLDDGNPCTLESCLAGQCHVNDLDGPSCDDGNACTLTDTCDHGTCQGGAPVVCTAKGPCHEVGICNPSTGLCSDPIKPDGSACDDGSDCTQSDGCHAGICVGGSPVVCTALDPCHQIGTCNPATGICTNPARPDGTPCDDSDACSQTDSCQAGSCTGANPLLCSAMDQCHLAGTCNPLTGVCSDPVKSDGTLCSDGDACTPTDQCQAGACMGSNAVVCAPIDQCHEKGACDTMTGVCTNPAKQDGTFCDDGNPQTIGDHCTNGMCVGEGCDCTGMGDCCDGCHPINEDGDCDDGDSCTQKDACTLGACTGAEPVICMALDQCHWAGVCDPQTGACSHPALPDDDPCEDGLFCTVSDTCQSGTCQAGVDRDCSGLADVCNDAECNDEYDTCWKVPKPTDTQCGDALWCNEGVVNLPDTCLGGDCLEGGTQSCTPYKACKSATECAIACKDEGDCVPGFECLQSVCWNGALPVADAGDDQQVDEGVLVELDGTGSTDPDGDELQYQWEQDSGPPMNVGDPGAPNPTFLAPFVGSDTEIVFSLVVNDGLAASAPDTVTVLVRDTSTEEATADTLSADTAAPGDVLAPDKPFAWDGWIQPDTTGSKPDVVIQEDIPLFSKPGADCSAGHAGIAGSAPGLIPLGLLLGLAFLFRKRESGR